MDKLEGVFEIRATKESARECLQEKMCFYTIIKLAIVFFGSLAVFFGFHILKNTIYFEVIGHFVVADVRLSADFIKHASYSRVTSWLVPKGVI